MIKALKFLLIIIVWFLVIEYLFMISFILGLAVGMFLTVYIVKKQEDNEMKKLKPSGTIIIDGNPKSAKKIKKMVDKKHMSKKSVAKKQEYKMQERRRYCHLKIIFKEKKNE